MNNPRLRDVRVNVQVDPGQNLAEEFFSYLGDLFKHLSLKRFRCDDLLPMMIIHHVNDTHSAFENVLNFPSVLDSVSDAPRRRHAVTEAIVCFFVRKGWKEIRLMSWLFLTTA